MAISSPGGVDDSGSYSSLSSDSGLGPTQLVQNMDALIEQVQSAVQRLEDDKLGHVRQETVERELCSRGKNLRGQLDALLQPNGAWTLRDMFGEDGFRIRLIREVSHQSLAACQKHATIFHDVINRANAIEASLGSPRTRYSMGRPIDALNPEGQLSSRSSVSSSSTDLTSLADQSLTPSLHASPLPFPSLQETQAKNAIDLALQKFQETLDLANRFDSEDPQPSAWAHRSQSRSENRRRVSCKDADSSFSVRGRSWKESRLVLADLRGMADKSRGLSLSAWDAEGKVYTNLADAIGDAKGYHRSADDEEVKLQWMWADHPSVIDTARRCFHWRWSSWKNPRNTVQEMLAHATGGRNRPVRLVAQSVKVCGSVNDAISFLEAVHLEYHGESPQE